MLMGGGAGGGSGTAGALVPTSGSTGQTANQPKVQIEVNGTNSSSQAVLNLANGSNTTVTDAGSGQIEVNVPVATSSVLGVVKPDGTIITDTAGAITVPTASSSQFGVVKVDGTTITSAAGVISAVGGGGGGGSISAGTFAGLPGSPSAGQLYLFTNSLYDMAVFQSSAWVYLKDGKQMTPPSGFSWMNQSTAVVNTTNGGETVTSALGAGSVNINGRYVSYPSAPFTRTVCGRITNFGRNGTTAVNGTAGLFLTDGTKALIYGFAGPFGSPTFAVTLLYNSGPSMTNINANVITPMSYWPPGGSLVWLRMDDGVTTSGKRTFFLSLDGYTFIQIYQESNTQFLTPTRIGYFVTAVDSGCYTTFDVLHWA